MLIGLQALKSPNTIKKIKPRMIVAIFNGNPRATNISCYSLTNVSEETDLITFYNELSSLVHSIPNHNAHLEAAAECIPTKQRAKPWVPWKILMVRKKHEDMKTASKCNRKNPTNINTLKLKKAPKELANIYLKNKQNTYKIRSIRLETCLKIDNLGQHGKL